MADGIPKGTPTPGPEQPAVAGRLADLSPAKRALLEARLRKAREAGPTPTIPRRADRGFGPLSFTQELMWLVAQLNPESAAYMVPRILWMRGPLHVEALRRGLREVVARHEILRTVYQVKDGAPIQVVCEAELEVP